MKIAALWIAASLLAIGPVFGQVDSATLQFPKVEGWAGERIPFYIELRAPGSFAGTASFSLPQLPRTTILKLGNPVISSEEIDGESWFVQTHEFALFSQFSGTLAIPAIEVRFSARDGFTGPPIDRQGQTLPSNITIQRPAGVAADTYLLTTEALKIEETWSSSETSIQVGETITRTLQIEAAGMTAMAFPPPPTASPVGVRLYQSPPSVDDSIQRGELQGQREDALTYLFQDSGPKTLPAIRYIWWNPKTEKLETLDLESRSFTVTSAASIAADNKTKASTERGLGLWLIFLVMLALVGFGVALHPSVRNLIRRLWLRVYPPETLAAWRLRSACRRNDPLAANTAWLAWARTTGLDSSTDPALQVAIQDLQQQIYSSHPVSPWNGKGLAQAFREFLRMHRTKDPALRTSSLPPLNRTA